MKKTTGVWMVGIFIMGMVTALSVGAAEKESHPELSEQERLMACSECHREATPDVTKEWYESVHGIAMVKCYQCHGTFESFAVTPSRQTCGTCHADRLEKYKDKPDCWECHTPHLFKANK